MVDSHEIAERSRLLSHKLYATQIRTQPRLLDQARKSIEESVQDGVATVGERLWHHVLQLELDEIVEYMVDDSEGGRLLRSNSPFSRIIGVRDLKTRTKLWQQARIEVLAQTTSSVRSVA